MFFVFQVDIPVDTKSKNYNESIEEFKKVNKVTLRSQQLDLTTSLAVGTIQDGEDHTE